MQKWTRLQTAEKSGLDPVTNSLLPKAFVQGYKMEVLFYEDEFGYLDVSWI